MEGSGGVWRRKCGRNGLTGRLCRGSRENGLRLPDVQSDASCNRIFPPLITNKDSHHNQGRSRGRLSCIFPKNQCMCSRVYLRFVSKLRRNLLCFLYPSLAFFPRLSCLAGIAYVPSRAPSAERAICASVEKGCPGPSSR